VTFTALLRLLTPRRRVLLAVVFLLLVASALDLAQPWLAGRLAAVLLAESAEEWSLRQLLLVWLALVVARAGVAFGSRYTIGSAGELMTARLRSRLYQHLQALPLAYYQQRRGGDVLTLLSNDAEIVSGFVTGTLVQLLPLLLTFTGAAVMMLLIDPLIAALALALLPLYFLAIKLIGRRIRPLSRAWVDAYSALVVLVRENLDMLPAIKAFTREGAESRRFEAHNAGLLSLSRRQLLAQSLLGPAVGLLAGLGVLLLLWLGSARIAAGALAPAALVSLLLYAMLLTQPLRGLADLYGQVQRSRGSAGRIVEFLGEQPEPADAGAPELAAVRGEVSFERVCFGYPGRAPVLRDFDLQIAAGETVALTGPNGAGKSTLAHLLLRFADPDAGRILLDGTDIRGVSLASLRRRIGLVAQHTLLVNGTVAANIAYGEPLVAREAIERAARAAHAHDFISALPAGYDTLIGDQGLRLSGGQRQRISLARTLLTDPAVLILDEATSMFDPGGEAGFIGECRELLAGKTAILITHRPASLALADRVVEMVTELPRPGGTAQGRFL
jgi:ATP-binding cassette subfamily B protein